MSDLSIGKIEAETDSPMKKNRIMGGNCMLNIGHCDKLRNSDVSMSSLSVIHLQDGGNSECHSVL